MVVTRRAAAPSAPTSRSNSSQAIPTVKNKAPQDSVPARGPTSTSPNPEDANGIVEAPTTVAPNKKGKNKKSKRRKDKSSRSFLDLCIRVFLFIFTIYTLSVCPTDDHLQKPICRGLDEYRRLILEPYLLPPVRLALAHPAVAPYLERATPYAVRFVATAKPVVIRTQQEWNTRVVPQWKKRIVPQWNRHAIPAWNKYAAPYVDRVNQQVEPYVQKASVMYRTKVDPIVWGTVRTLRVWQIQARPYVILAAQKTHSGYQKAKPYAIPILQRLRALFSDLVQFLIIQRRQFVDPHLKRIWEGVIELSSGKPTTTIREHHNGDSFPGSTNTHTPSVPPPTIIQASHTPNTFDVTVEVDFDEATSSEHATTPILHPLAMQPTPSDLPSVPTPTDQDVSSSSIASEVTLSSAFTQTSKSSSAPPAPVDEEFVAPTLPLPSLEPTLSTMATSLLRPKDPQVVEATTEGVPTASLVTEDVDETRLPVSTPPVSSSITQSPPAVDGDDIDLDAFYAELGLADDEGPTSDDDDTTLPADTETEEEKAEQLRLYQLEVAQKRAAITSRHAKWEEELEVAIADGLKTLRKNLVALRKSAALDLKQSETIRKDVEGLVNESEKFLRGTEKYFTTLMRESRRVEEKRPMWERVVEKVNTRFGERLAQTESLVNGWSQGVFNQELEEVRRLSDGVRDIADRAQADIGLDYAWLDDVTYQDWQRYHDLVRRSDNFTELALSIQNGSHPTPPVNPVTPALADLQSEVQDIVVGFETRLRRIKRNGDRTFGSVERSDNSEAEEVDDTNDETISILPIGKEGSAPDQVVIGRSKEEVVEAFNRAAEVDPNATPIPKDNVQDAEEVVGSLASEVEVETTVQSTLPVDHHQEL